MRLNLMPPELKGSYGYARRNVSLRSWVIALFIALVGLLSIIGFGLVSMQANINDYSAQVSQTEKRLKGEKLDETKKQVQDISGTFKLSVKVLSQEVLFSKLITQIGAVMPNGTILTGLTIDQLTGGLTLAASATNYTTGTQIQVNLADPANKIFSKVDINSIDCQSDAPSSYPCTVQVRALFNKNNPFLLVNQGKQ